jgi:hypothetical protein
MASKKPFKKTLKKTQSGAQAIHVDLKGGQHVVGLGNIRVFLVPDGNAWFAQGLEIDYAAQGSSASEAKKHFEIGLSATIEQHLKIKGSIDGLLKFAPTEVINELLGLDGEARHYYSSISAHKLPAELPYQALNFFIPQLAEEVCP